MANTIRIKRSTNTQTPQTLANAELAFSEISSTLFIGKGSGGEGGSATSIEAIGGPGAFVTLSSNQTNISGNKTFTGSVNIGAAVATTASAGDSSTKVATTAFVQGEGFLRAGDNIGSATATTPSSQDNDTSVATTAFVKNQGYLVANSGITGATKTKITFDAKGLVTGGADLTAADIPSLAHTKISDFDAGVRTNRLDQMAAPAAYVSMGSQRITNLAEPQSASDAATKGYADALVTGLDIKESCRVATTANIGLTGNGPVLIDNTTLFSGDRVLVKDQSNGSENGIYVFNYTDGSTWALTRAVDADGSDEVTSGAFTFIEEGSTNADAGFVLTNDGTVLVGDTSLTFTQFSGAGMVVAGNGLSKSGNTLDVGVGTGLSVGANAVGLAGQALALHNFESSGPIVRTGASAYTTRSISTESSGLSIANGDFINGNPTISLSAALSTVGGLTPAANKLAYYTGSEAASLTTLSSFGRSLIDDASASSARSTLGLGNMSTQNNNAVNIDGGTIDGITFDGGSF